MKRMVSLASALLVSLIVLTGMGLPVAKAQGFDGDRVVLGENYVLRSGETLDGNLAVLGGTAAIETGAAVRGDVSVVGGVLTLDGSITGNLSLIGGSVHLGETAVVEGDLASFAGSVEQAPGAEVRGDIFSGVRTPPQIQPSPVVPDIVDSEMTPRSWFARFFSWQLGTIGSILLMGLLGIVLVLVAPRAVGRVASATAMQPALTFGVGFLTLVVGAFAGAILLIACGFGLLVWLTLVIASVLGWIGVALWLGQRLLGALKLHTASTIGEVLIGVVAITFLARLPWCFGWLPWLLFVSWGLGAVVLTRFGTQDANGPHGLGSRSPYRSLQSGAGSSYAPLPASSDLSLSKPSVQDETQLMEPPSKAGIEPAPNDETGTVTSPAEPNSQA
jgi:hypothetical protein